MQPHPKLLKWLFVHRFKIEIVIVLLVVLSVILKIAGTGGSDEALMISMTILAGFYFVSAFFMVEMNSVLMVITLKVFSIASSVCIIGLLFTILKLSGAQQMLMIGVTSMGLAAVGLVFQATRVWNNNYLPLLIRVVALGVISLNTLLAVIKPQ